MSEKTRLINTFCTIVKRFALFVKNNTEDPKAEYYYSQTCLLLYNTPNLVIEEAGPDLFTNHELIKKGNYDKMVNRFKEEAIDKKFEDPNNQETANYILPVLIKLLNEVSEKDKKHLVE